MLRHESGRLAAQRTAGIFEPGLREAVIEQQINLPAEIGVDVQVHALRTLLADLLERRYRLLDGNVVARDVVERKTGIHPTVESLPAVTHLVVACGAGIEL